MKKLSKKEISNALHETANYFKSNARDTILLENYGKHLFEIGIISSRVNASFKILDVGGGLGVNLLVLKKLFDKNIEGYLVDRFEEYTEDNRMGEAGEILNILKNHEIKIYSQDFLLIPKLPFDSSVFDMVTIFDVTEHFPKHPLEILNEINRVLKPGGEVIIAGPNSVALEKRIRFLFGKHPTIPFDLWVKDVYYSHYREYDKKEQKKLLEISNFKNVVTYMSNETLRTQVFKSYYNFKRRIYAPIMIYLTIFFIIGFIFHNLRPSIYCIGEK
jgi:SAM-dependent methyltransferase